MKIKSYYILFIAVFFSITLSAQENEDLKITTEDVAVKSNKKIRPYNPLAPAKAAFYSAVLPGLGQAYNKQYWKIPLVYGALGAGAYFYIENTNNYNEIRDIYKRRLAGFRDDRFIASDGTELVTEEGLISLQRRYKRDQELSVLVTVGLYVLNIVDANVAAHLQQYNISKDLSLKPQIQFDQFDYKPNYGLTLNFNF